MRGWLINTTAVLVSVLPVTVITYAFKAKFGIEILGGASLGHVPFLAKFFLSLSALSLAYFWLLFLLPLAFFSLTWFFGPQSNIGKRPNSSFEARLKTAIVEETPWRITKWLAVMWVPVTLVGILLL